MNKSNPSYQMTLILMPVVAQTVIMMVNGNVGTGIAVAGAFGLVRFRSMQYKAEDILLIFVAVTIGLATSIGYIGFASLFTFIVCVIMTVFKKTGNFGRQHLELRITCPESMNYAEELNDVFEKFTASSELLSVRTTNMGSLFKLTYDVVMKNRNEIQNFINELRIRNSNLEINLGVFPEVSE
ncbi:MAG: DUF4956 domain-containing protein [Erysipelotrichaceae bacterium]|nr:DUF4956 domain-containing protein [Erysipelotrichaceae bacterium]MBR2746144.1 DUF4956 domain-containing protein [Erysipelotrichaceae bacterium]